MDLKEIGVIVGLVVGIPSLIAMLAWVATSVANPSSENLAQGSEIVADAAIPFYVPIIEWLSGFGELGAFLIIGLVILLAKMGIIGGKH